MRAKDVLAAWGRLAPKMKKVIPSEDKKVLAAQKQTMEERKWQTPAAS